MTESKTPKVSVPDPQALFAAGVGSMGLAVKAMATAVQTSADAFQAELSKSSKVLSDLEQSCRTEAKNNREAKALGEAVRSLSQVDADAQSESNRLLGELSKKLDGAHKLAIFYERIADDLKRVREDLEGTRVEDRDAVVGILEDLGRYVDLVGRFPKS